MSEDCIPTLLDWDRIEKEIRELDQNGYQKNIDVKGSILPDLKSSLMFIPLKIRRACKNLSSGVESAKKLYLEKIGVTFSVCGAFFVALPATIFNTLATNVFFFLGDIFLLSIFALEKRNWLIVQNSIFAILAMWGIINNLPGVL